MTTRILKSTDCGNSPKNKLVQELTIAMARADEAKLRELVTNDVRWLAIGRKPVDGVDAVCKAVSRHGPAVAVAIDKVASHGRAGAINGVITIGGKDRAFCHMIEFGDSKGTSVGVLQTYTITLKS